MARADVGQPPCRRVVNAKERGDETADPFTAQVTIRVREQIRRAADLGRMGVKDGLNHRDDHGGGDPEAPVAPGIHKLFSGDGENHARRCLR